MNNIERALELNKISSLSYEESYIYSRKITKMSIYKTLKIALPIIISNIILLFIIGIRSYIKYSDGKILEIAFIFFMIEVVGAIICCVLGILLEKKSFEKHKPQYQRSLLYVVDSNKKTKECRS